MSPSPHSERLREIRVYLAEDAAIDDMPRAHPSSPTPMLRDLLAAYDGLEEQLESIQQERERLREALTWCNDHRDSERFHSVAESALNFAVSYPASEPEQEAK